MNTAAIGDLLEKIGGFLELIKEHHVLLFLNVVLQVLTPL
jgi:hypothetical protein